MVSILLNSAVANDARCLTTQELHPKLPRTTCRAG